MTLKPWRFLLIGLALATIVALAACGESEEEATSSPSPQSTSIPQGGSLTLATTTSTADTGLLDALLPGFEKECGCNVKVVAVGTGEALALGQKCDADLVLVHARAKEDQFVNDGYGVNRRDVMYNDFIIVGPAGDPAGIKGLTDAKEAVKKIAQAKATFVSRGDGSGTETKEKDLWKKAGLAPTPSDSWYLSVGQGMGATLTIAMEKQAYTLSDRGTYLSMKSTLDLQILVEGDKDLFNPYGVIAVNKAKCGSVRYDLAIAFIDWLTGTDTQQKIGEFGKDKFGQALFVPDSEQWQAAHPK